MATVRAHLLLAVAISLIHRDLSESRLYCQEDRHRFAGTAIFQCILSMPFIIFYPICTSSLHWSCLVSSVRLCPWFRPPIIWAILKCWSLSLQWKSGDVAMILSSPWQFPLQILTVSWGSDPQNIVFFYLWFCKESTLQNHILTPRDEGYNIIMDMWTYGKLDGLDFVKVPDPLGGVPKWSLFLQMLERFLSQF